MSLIIKDDLIVCLQKDNMIDCGPGRCSVELTCKIAQFTFGRGEKLLLDMNAELLDVINRLRSNHPDLIISYGRVPSNLFTKDDILNYAHRIHLCEAKVDDCAQTVFEFYNDLTACEFVDIMENCHWSTHHKKKRVTADDLLNMLNSFHMFVQRGVSYTDEFLADIETFEEALKNCQDVKEIHDVSNDTPDSDRTLEPEPDK